jgi:hypothetical protein
MDHIEKLLEKQLTPVFGRKAVPDLLPGIISPKTLANLDSLGKGPRSIKAGRAVLYTRETFIPWLLNHLEISANC